MLIQMSGRAEKAKYRELPRPKGGPRTVISLEAAGDMSLRHLPERESFLRSLGIEPGRAVMLHQVHSRTVLTVGRAPGSAEAAPPDLAWPAPRPASADDLPDGDGLITAEREAALCITVADCLPIVLHDAGSGAFGLLHSGWKGTGIAADGCTLLEARCGSRPSALTAVLGPCIGPCCYDVPAERAELFRRRFAGAAVHRRQGKHYLDLRAANRRLLQAAGVGTVLSDAACTSCTPELGSYRRDGPARYTLMLVVSGYF